MLFPRREDGFEPCGCSSPRILVWGMSFSFELFFFFLGGGGLFILVLVLFWPFVGVGAEDGSGRHPRGPFTERRAPWVTPRPSCPLRGLVEEGWDRPLLAFIAFL